MNISQINLALSEVREAKSTWADRVTEFNSGVLAVMRRLMYEAVANRMSAEQIAAASGYTPKRVRAMMRNVGLNPHEGKTVLSQKAAEALANNADLLGIEPREMDLMSPLAYLPMGKELRTQIRAEAVSQVHEDETDPNDAPAHFTPALDVLRLVRSEAADFCNLISNHGTDCTCFTVIKQIDNRIAEMERLHEDDFFHDPVSGNDLAARVRNLYRDGQFLSALADYAEGYPTRNGLETELDVLAALEKALGLEAQS